MLFFNIKIMRRPMKNLQDKSKWTPKGPGGRLRRLQSKVDILLNDRMPKTHFKRRKKNKKGLAGKALGALTGKIGNFFQRKKKVEEKKSELEESDTEDDKDKKKKNKKSKKKKKKKKKSKKNNNDKGGKTADEDLTADEGQDEGKHSEGKMEESKQSKK